MLVCFKNKMLLFQMKMRFYSKNVSNENIRKEKKIEGKMKNRVKEVFFKGLNISD